MSKTVADIIKQSGIKMHLYCVVCKQPFIRDYPKNYKGGIKMVCSDECLEIWRAR